MKVILESGTVKVNLKSFQKKLKNSRSPNANNDSKHLNRFIITLFNVKYFVLTDTWLSDELMRFLNSNTEIGFDNYKAYLTDRNILTSSDLGVVDSWCVHMQINPNKFWNYKIYLR